MIAFHIAAPTAHDRLLAAAHALSLRVLTSPTGAALPPEAPAPARRVSGPQEAYTLGYRLVARAAPDRESE